MTLTGTVLTADVPDLGVSTTCGRLDNSLSEGGKAKARWAEPKLGLLADGGEGDVIVPVDTIVGRGGISIGTVASCGALGLDDSKLSFGISFDAKPESIFLGVVDGASKTREGFANASSARASVTR